MASDPQSLPQYRPGGVLVDEAQGTPGGAMGARHMVLIDQLIAWAIANPGKGWNLVAQRLGLSAVFVRHVVASDAFRERYAQVQNRTIEELGIIPLRDKIAIAADLAVERIIEKLPMMEGTRDILDAADMLLTQSLGKPGGGPAPAPVHNTIIIQQAIKDGRASLLGDAGDHGTVVDALAPELPHSASASPPQLSVPEGASPEANQGAAP